jgi:hypothetical protein
MKLYRFVSYIFLCHVSFLHGAVGIYMLLPSCALLINDSTNNNACEMKVFYMIFVLVVYSEDLYQISVKEIN